MAKIKTPAVQTEEIVIGDLEVGNLIKHKNEWLPVTRMYPSDVYEDQIVIVTAKGIVSVSFDFETIDIAVSE
jgi:hypothetical protein